MRKLLSILLLAIFGLPFASPLFAATASAETNVPACCRHNGKHHCMGMVERDQSASNKTELRALTEKCPYCPASIVTSQHSDTALASAAMIYAAVVSHPVVQAQTESKWRIARDRSRGKRGPPASSLL